MVRFLGFDISRSRTQAARPVPTPRHSWSRRRPDPSTVNVTDRVQDTARRGYEVPGEGSQFMGTHAMTDVATFDADIHRMLPLLRRVARQEYEQNPYVRKTVRLWKQNIVGPDGIKLRSMPRMDDGTIDRELAKVVEEGWMQFSKFGVPDVTGRLSMKDIENIVVFELLVDGEFIGVDHVRGPWGFQLELLDPQQIDPRFVRRRKEGESREIVMGVELDRLRRPRAYHISPDPGIDATGFMFSRRRAGRQREGRVRRLARNICHVMEPEFARQIRGVPGLATTLSRWENVRGYEDSEMLAARIGASKLGFLSKSDDGTAQLADDTDEKGNQVINSEPGSITQLDPGVTFSEWDPTHPQSNFPPFLKTQLQAAGSGSDVGYHEMSGDMSSVNFSSLRQMNISQRDLWRMIHRIVSSQFCDWMFRKWIRAALLRPDMLGVSLDDLSPRQMMEIENVVWVPRSWEHVQPREQAAAETSQLDNRTRSVSSIIRERGDDPDEVFEEIADEERKMREMGIEPRTMASRPSGMMPSGMMPNDPDDE